MEESEFCALLNVFAFPAYEIKPNIERTQTFLERAMWERQSIAFCAHSLRVERWTIQTVDRYCSEEANEKTKKNKFEGASIWELNEQGTTVARREQRKHKTKFHCWWIDCTSLMHVYLSADAFDNRQFSCFLCYAANFIPLMLSLLSSFFSLPFFFSGAFRIRFALFDFFSIIVSSRE